MISEDERIIFLSTLLNELSQHSWKPELRSLGIPNYLIMLMTEPLSSSMKEIKKNYQHLRQFIVLLLIFSFWIEQNPNKALIPFHCLMSNFCK